MWKTQFIFLLCLYSVFGPACAEAHKPTSVADLAWMSGLWANDTSEEYWSEPKNGSVFGYNRQLKDGGTLFFEHLQLTEVDGEVTYWANPLGKGWTPFLLTKSSPNSATFTNPEHDYPKLIRYIRAGSVLEVEISDGEMKKSCWSWRKVR